MSDDTTAWLELGLERPTVVRDVELTLGGDDTRRRSVTVSTDRGSARAVLRPACNLAAGSLGDRRNGHVGTARDSIQGGPG